MRADPCSPAMTETLHRKAKSFSWSIFKSMYSILMPPWIYTKATSQTHLFSTEFELWILFGAPCDRKVPNLEPQWCFFQDGEDWEVFSREADPRRANPFVKTEFVYPHSHPSSLAIADLMWGSLYIWRHICTPLVDMGRWKCEQKSTIKAFQGWIMYRQIFTTFPVCIKLFNCCICLGVFVGN